jgi:hypothetical protein
MAPVPSPPQSPVAARWSLRLVGPAFLVGAVLALLPALLLWGFTVDDALIPARYATHIARGAGYRFNVQGPVTDGVTPLGWAYLLAPFASGGAVGAFAAAKHLGLVTWVLAAGALGVAVVRSGRARRRFLALALLPLSAPLAAWSVAGLETGVVTALVAFGLTARVHQRARVGALLLGLAAGWRPELVPFAVVASAAPAPPAAPAGVATPPRAGADDGRAALPGAQPRLARSEVALRVALAAMPFLGVAVARKLVFGMAAPLSALAKAPDAELGARYALACFLLTGPLAIVAPLAWRRLDGFARGLVVAVAVHFGAIALAGGDWMPLSRLAVPCLPAVVLAAAYLLDASDARASAVRMALALAGQLFAMAKVGPAAARVGEDRMALVGDLAPVLRDARVVAALDIGWVGAATDASIVDLAGVTDPAVAALPGGHTSKQIPATLLDTRQVDTLVLLLADGAEVRGRWYESHFARAVEQRVAMLTREEYQLLAVSQGPLRYLVVRRSDTRQATR